MTISFDRISTQYDETRGVPPEVSAQITNCILDQVSTITDPQFIEPGIGTGRIALPIVQRGYAYTGVDISDKMMAELRQKLQSNSHRLTLIQADVTALPLADHSFDVALAVHLLHLIPNWQQALAEIRRVLKPNGVFLYTHGRTHAVAPDDVEFNQGRVEFDQQWRSILSGYGFELADYGASEPEVLSLLQSQGASLEPVIAAQWQIEQTVGSLLSHYQNRLYSSCWQIPDDIFTRAIEDLNRWCQQHYQSLQFDLSHMAQFKMVVVRDWARFNQ